jgi:hypothetical protein
MFPLGRAYLRFFDGQGLITECEIENPCFSHQMAAARDRPEWVDSSHLRPSSTLALNSHQASTLIRSARIGCRRTNHADARRLCRNI